jgi:two-component system nitrogen regulation sensor histidine kinase NtrY
MISQALINLLKNAGESIESRIKNDHQLEVFGQIEVIAMPIDTILKICIIDNGVGLPADRTRLFEPYVTTREHGTGLGLAIVKKIIEEHGGVFSLEDAPPLSNTGIVGAAAVIELPYYKTQQS